VNELWGINHVTFLTADMDRLAAFYEDVLGRAGSLSCPSLSTMEGTP
jgi:hypothetical protein